MMPALRQFIMEEFVRDGSPIDETTNLLEQEIIDSLGIFTLIGFIEDRFGVRVAPEEVNLENFETLAAIASLVDQKLG
ncbi:MAG TPA: acyl carrier protein [Acidimicrobiia bacterium]|nr:acyl carrier protein [Acidimicrobiia bacterium]